MIKETKAYSLYCDGCGNRYEPEFSIWEQPGDMLDEAMLSEWLVRDGKHYCFDCSLAFIDDDTEDR